jgi:hypothetical protein
MATETTAKMNPTPGARLNVHGLRDYYCQGCTNREQRIELVGRKTGDAVTAMITGIIQCSLRTENIAFTITKMVAVAKITFEFLVICLFHSRLIFQSIH